MDIVQKYAKAFSRVYDDTITREIVDRLELAARFLYVHRRALFLLRVSVIDRKVREEAILEFCDRFKLGDAIKKLVKVLLNDKRASLLAPVFEAIGMLYKKRNSIVEIAVTSSCVLSDAQRSSLEAFLARHIVGEKTYTYTVDTSLIAGVRVLSDSCLWEFSIEKQLRELYHCAIW